MCPLLFVRLARAPTTQRKPAWFQVFAGQSPRHKEAAPTRLREDVWPGLISGRRRGRGGGGPPAPHTQRGGGCRVPKKGGGAEVFFSPGGGESPASARGEK